MDHFHYRDRVLHCEDVPVAELAETVRHAAVRLQPGHAAAPPEADPDRVRRGEAAHLLQHQDQRQPPHLPAHGRARLRLRRDLRRRAVPRPARPAATGEQDRLRRRRQDRRRDALRPRERRLPVQRRERGGTAHPRRGRARRWARRPASPCGSTRTCRPRRTPRPTLASRASSSASTSRPSWTSPRASSATRTSKVVGLHMHLGSPILTAEPYRQGADEGLVADRRAPRSRGTTIEYLNMGGGFGIHYRKQEALPAERVRRGDPAGGQGDRLPARPGAGPVHRRQRRASCSAG